MSLQLKKSRIANGKGQNITYDTKAELYFVIHKHCPQVGGGFFIYESCITCAIFSFLPTPPPRYLDFSPGYYSLSQQIQTMRAPRGDDFVCY